ncbi:putative ribonuclease H protein [Vitis vinifera]|uniref:Putative ribonuclease H protein n=1 Tax=Vitis vinifera TaxID=29760 RepID=A0A438EZ87_VITVI|nr:putative ribonuclease H protein [Vitis vinifera]
MRLASSEAEGLEIHFSKEEVFVALIDPGKDKAQGLYHDFLVVLLGCVPKKGGAEDLKDFRPISLVGSLYKLLAKVLANRIKKVIGKVISESQNAFVEGRQILDVVLITNEVVDSRSKELRQGDPLSPYLFVIAMEVFSCLLRRAISGASYLGLKINLEKSELILVGKVHDIEDLALELERFHRRLEIWKRQYISKGGTLTLIQSTLSNMPIYFMSLFYLPRKVSLHLEKIQRDFLWGGGALVQKPHLVKGTWFAWIKKNGGLGVRNLALMNSTLLRGMAHSSSKWEIRYWALESNKEEWLILNGRLAYQNAWVPDVWNPVGNGDGWTLFFARAFNNWEIELVEYFLHRIQAFQVQREEEDRMFWTESKCGAFSIKSLYSILEPRGSSVFPSDNIWRVRVPPKVTFFAWEASCGKVLTLNQLQRRGSLWQTSVFFAFLK